MNSSMLILPASLRHTMIAHARWGYPLEVCGILGGTEKIISHLYAIYNVNQSPTRFEMDPEEQFWAMMELEDQGLEMLAFYHSHPKGPHRPSPTDVAQAYYPDVTHFIISLRDRARPVLRAFIIRQGIIKSTPYTIKSM